MAQTFNLSTERNLSQYEPLKLLYSIEQWDELLKAGGGGGGGGLAGVCSDCNFFLFKFPMHELFFFGEIRFLLGKSLEGHCMHFLWASRCACPRYTL